MIATNRLINTVFLLVFVFMGVFANWIFTLSLPQKIATHFNFAGKPDGFMTLLNFQSFITLSTICFPLVMVFMVGVLPAWFPSLVNISHRDYWFAPERKTKTLDYLFSMACKLGVLMVFFFVGLNVIIFLANNSNPVLMPKLPFFIVMLLFLLGVLLWVVMLFLKFRKVDLLKK
jgi:serine/threonine-protein kinase